MQQDQTEKDSKKVLAKTGIVASDVSEKAFDFTDKSAKKLSNVLHAEGVKSRIRTNDNESEENINLHKITKQGVTASTHSLGTVVTQIKTSVFREANNNKVLEHTETTENTGDINTESENSISNISNPISDSLVKTKVKTIADKTVDFVNRKTFDFQPSQGKISKTVTVLSKTGKTTSKISKKTAHKIRTVTKEIEDKSGGMETAIYKSNQAAKKVGFNVSKKFISFIVRSVMTTIKLFIKTLVSAFAVILPSAAPVIVVLVGVVAIFSMIFGLGASTNTVISKYENYMIKTQERYDAEVDEWMAENPDGIVVGVKGDYGMIDWRMPLSILQATQTSLSLDETEKDLLTTFDNAGLFEQHIVTEYKVKSENDSGEMEENVIPVMTIINPGYEDYMIWSDKNFGVLNDYMKKKNVLHPQESFTNDDMEIINSLYASDNFFDEFSDKFKLHTTMKGENTTENNFNSAEYNHLNIFTQSGYKGQCTWYAYGRALKLTGKKMPSGDAQTWLTSAIAMGYPTGTRPSVNSVVVMTGGQFGHVAYVEAWDGKLIRVSEGNINNPMSGTNQMVEYAREHAVELVYEAEYDSYEEFCAVHESWGLTVVGFIYLE